MIRLDTPNPAMEPEQVDELQVTNIKQLRNTLNKQGANILFQKVTNTPFTTAATTFTLLPGWEAAFVSSGGLITISFCSSVSFLANTLLYVKMRIDGDENQSRIIYMDCQSPISWPINFTYKAKLGEGRHKVEILTAQAANTTIFSNGSTTTELLIEEISL